jgi:hypothetical protein
MNAIVSLSADEFIVLVDRAENGTPAGMGWGTYENVLCECCGKTFTTVAKTGTRGLVCPHCNDIIPDYLWLEALNGVYGEGSFLNPVGWEYASMNRN